MENAVQSEHETSVWPALVGLSVLLTALSIISYFQWQLHTLGILLFGAMLAFLAIGAAGWARESFQHGLEVEDGLGPIAVAAFIVSEVIIFGTVFVAFWFFRITHIDTWASYIPEGLEISLAIWLTLILWASSLTIVLSEKAFLAGNKSGALIERWPLCSHVPVAEHHE